MSAELILLGAALLLSIIDMVRDGADTMNCAAVLIVAALLVS